MFRIISFALGCIVVLCAIPAAAQTSAQFSQADKYNAVKAVLQREYDRQNPKSNVSEAEKAEYDLADGSACKFTFNYLGLFEDDKGEEKPQHKNDDIADIVLLAESIVVWEGDLRRLHVPETIWRSVIERYEAEQLGPEPISDETDLVAELNANMLRAGRAQPKFVFKPGCGGEGQDATFALDPPAGQLFLIPVFLYKVCQVQHLNPIDFKSCDRWKEIVNEHVGDASGDYMYLARWSDGIVRCGLINSDDFGKMNKEQKGGQTPRIVIKKLRSPECSPAL